MSRNSKIEWCDTTWNVVTGCTKVSEGCRNCYAELMASRFWKDRKFSDVQCHEDRLNYPLKIKWKIPSRVFVNSMSDLFHPDVPDGFIFACFTRMIEAKDHQFLILTKRPERMKSWIVNNWMKDYEGNPIESIYKNIWLGVSVEDQKTADERIPLLLQTPAAVRFVSCEPLLGPLDLWKFATREETFGSMYDHRGSYGFYPGLPKEPVKYHEGIDWIIVGGESGKNARPMHPGWVRSIQDQCENAGVPFFFKQWGEWLPNVYGDMSIPANTNFDKKHFLFSDGIAVCRVGKKNAGRLLDGREWNEFPVSEFAEVK